MDTKTARNSCSLCGKGREAWEGEGITIGNGSYCDEQCARTANRRDPARPERAINEVEKKDAYNANDGQPPLDEAPVDAGGSRE